MQDKYTALERLKGLLDQGALSEEEFEREKALVLAGHKSGGSHFGKVALVVIGIVIATGLGVLIATSALDAPDANIEKSPLKLEPSEAPTLVATPEVIPTPADPYQGAKQTGCRQNTCSWEKVLTIRTVKRAPNGVLKLEESYQGTMEVGSRRPPSTYSASLPIKWETMQTYVFCSTEQPSTAFMDRWSGNPRWVGHLLDLFDTYGYNRPSAQTYMRVCHDVDFDRNDIEKVMSRLGYRPGTPNGQVDLSKPTDLASPPQLPTDEGGASQG